MRTSFIFLIITVLVFEACSSDNKREKEAGERLIQVESLIRKKSYNNARLILDSIDLLYPKLIKIRRRVAALKDTVSVAESRRSLAYCTQYIPLKKSQFDSLSKAFRFEKNIKYQDVGNYVFKTQITENNPSRSYLKAYVDENAVLYFVSNYSGRPIKHMMVKVSIGELYARTDTVRYGDAGYHSYDDGGGHWETLTFKNDENKGVVAFVANNSTQNIQVTLVANKGSYIYNLSSADKKAIAETYKLWKVKKDLVVMEIEKKKALAKIERLSTHR